MFKKVFKFIQGLTYQNRLEEYIKAKNPQHVGDVERYALEFQRSFRHWA